MRLQWALPAGLLLVALAPAQEKPPVLRVGLLPADHRMDGVLDEPAWQTADAIDGLTTIVPEEGGRPSSRTVVRVLADSRSLVIGVRCDDPEAARIVSYSVARDAGLSSEDHVKIVLGTFLDGRTGYVFAVNPSGARYDAVVANRGEGEDSKWDGVWEAKTVRDARGWSAEIRIPILTLSFKEGLDRWHFNVRRRVQRLLETSRWASPRRDYRITQTSRAGLLVGLPRFELGLGLSVKPAVVGSFGKAAPGTDAEFDGDASLDVLWRATSDLTAALTVNTDFAETDVDTRRTNLTRFPLFFPEKRSFFVEGADAFDFGLGLGTDVIPFHSRRIGLVGGREVPILVGGKVTGRVNGTSVGAIGVKTNDEPDVAPEAAMGVVRLRQDVLAESSVGLIATAGDPLDREGSWLAGGDFTFQTSSFLGDRNFLVGVWGLTMDREGNSSGSESAWGTKIDYPNDLWDVAFTYKRIGADFDPSLGFVPRRGIHDYRLKADFAPRPELEWLRQTTYEFSSRLVTDLDNRWESFSVFLAPVVWDFESGDTIELFVSSKGERIDEDFEIADDVEIPAGRYDWTRYGITLEGASKRPLSGEIGWTFGPFYTGHLNSFEVDLEWNPMPLLRLGLSAEYNDGRLPQGDFKEDAYGLTVGLNFSPDLTLTSFVQYDTESDSIGANTRLHWTITPLSEVFLVGNFNAAKRDGDLRTESYETIMKVQHELRF